MTLKNIFGYFAMTSFIFSIIFGIILILTVGRKFDKLFKHRKLISDFDIPIHGALLRATHYGTCCVSTFYRNRPYHKYLYGNYDFKANSTLFDKIISGIYLFFGMIFLFLSFIFTIYHYAITFILKIF